MVTIRACLDAARKRLKAAGLESWDADARLLAQHALGVRREDFILTPEKHISDTESKKLDILLARREKREPVSRITGTRGFWKLDFKITPDTLDPRPDSETLIEAAIKHCPPQRRILDLGTGSGCLLLSLLHEWPEARGVGIDANAGAVAVAAENAARLGMSDRTTFSPVSWDDYRPELKFDVILCNPPYIGAEEMPALEPEVTEHDPLTALVAAEGGLACYKKLAAVLPDFLEQDGWAFFEIGHEQATPVTQIFENSGLHIRGILQDLGGRDRCVIVRRI